MVSSPVDDWCSTTYLHHVRKPRRRPGRLLGNAARTVARAAQDDAPISSESAAADKVNHLENFLYVKSMSNSKILLYSGGRKDSVADFYEEGEYDYMYPWLNQSVRQYRHCRLLQSWARASLSAMMAEVVHVGL